MLTPCLASLLAVATSATAVNPPEPIPHTKAENGNGRASALPDLLLGRPSVLVVGFSKASREATTFWADRLDRELAASGKPPVVRIAHLQSIPGFMRGLLLGSIKGGVPPEKRDSFWMLFENQDAWKQLMGFGPSDDAYLAVTDPQGRVVWRMHAGADEKAYAAAKGQMLEALAAAR